MLTISTPFIPAEDSFDKGQTGIHHGTTHATEQPLKDHLQHFVAASLVPQVDDPPVLASVPAERLESLARLSTLEQVWRLQEGQDPQYDAVWQSIEHARLKFHPFRVVVVVIKASGLRNTSSRSMCELCLSVHRDVVCVHVTVMVQGMCRSRC